MHQLYSTPLEDSRHELVGFVFEVVPVLIAVEVEDVTQQTNADVGPLPGRDELEVPDMCQILSRQVLAVKILTRNMPQLGGVLVPL